MSMDGRQTWIEPASRTLSSLILATDALLSDEHLRSCSQLFFPLLQPGADSDLSRNTRQRTLVKTVVQIYKLKTQLLGNYCQYKPKSPKD